jgi:hypothetical protein
MTGIFTESPVDITKARNLQTEYRLQISRFLFLLLCYTDSEHFGIPEYAIDSFGFHQAEPSCLHGKGFKRKAIAAQGDLPPERDMRTESVVAVDLIARLLQIGANALMKLFKVGILLDPHPENIIFKAADLGEGEGYGRGEMSRHTFAGGRIIGDLAQKQYCQMQVFGPCEISGGTVFELLLNIKQPFLCRFIKLKCNKQSHFIHRLSLQEPFSFVCRQTHRKKSAPMCRNPAARLSRLLRLHAP